MYGDAEFVPMATLVNGTLCATLAGLSKVYRACGYRVGWAVFSGEIDQAGDYLNALDKLSSLRLCSNVPGQWAVQTALGGYQSIYELTRPGGRLFQSRQAILDGVAASKYLQVHARARQHGSAHDVAGDVDAAGRESPGAALRSARQRSLRSAVAAAPLLGSQSSE